MDFVIFIVTTAVAILTSLYLFGQSQVSYLKKNWVQYRCNPMYMPFAGLVGDSVVSNFTKCTMKGFQDYAGYMMDPIMGEFAVVNETVTEIGGAMNSMRSMMSGVRGGFLGILGTVFGKIQNLVSQFQYIIIRMRTLLSRIVGVMLSFIYVFYTGMETGTSVMNGPIGQTVSFLCFDPETFIVLKSNIGIPMKNVKVGDVLYRGETVRAVYTVSGKDVKLFFLNGVVVSGHHKVRIPSGNIPVSKHPLAIPMDKTLDTLVCLDTDTHQIHLRGIEFLDFSEKNLPEPNYYPPNTRVVLNDGTMIDIELIQPNMILKNNNRVVGTVKHALGHSLITEKNTFSILRKDGHIQLVQDALFFMKITSE